MRITIRHTFDTDIDTYWSKVFFDPSYTTRLYLDVLGFKACRVVEQRDTGGGAITRTLHIEPSFNAPAVVQKVLGDRFYYTEVGTLDPVARRWKYKVIPAVMSDKVSIDAQFWVEPKGSVIERIAELDISARVFGIGGILEGFIEKENRSGYDKAAVFTNNFLREKGLNV